MKIVDESIFFSLEFLSQNSFWNVKSQFFPNKVVWQLGLVIGLSREFKPLANDLASLGLLSCSATAGMTL